MAATAQQQPQPGLSPPAGAPEPAVNRVGATSRITAGFRAVEQEQHGAGAIVADPLAAHMAGEDALATARSEWAKLAAAQGPGKHLRVPARNRLLDDELLAALEGLAAAADDGGCARDGGGGVAVNVVNIGCGMVRRQAAARERGYMMGSWPAAWCAGLQRQRPLHPGQQGSCFALATPHAGARAGHQAVEAGTAAASAGRLV